MKLILSLHLLSVYTPSDFEVMTKCPKVSTTGGDVMNTMVVPNMRTVYLRNVPVLCEEVPSFESLLLCILSR